MATNTERVLATNRLVDSAGNTEVLKSDRSVAHCVSQGSTTPTKDSRRKSGIRLIRLLCLAGAGYVIGICRYSKNARLRFLASLSTLSNETISM